MYIVQSSGRINDKNPEVIDNNTVSTIGEKDNGLVHMIVAGNIYDAVYDEVYQYKLDVEAVGYTVEIIRWDYL